MDDVQTPENPGPFDPTLETPEQLRQRKSQYRLVKARTVSPLYDNADLYQRDAALQERMVRTGILLAQADYTESNGTVIKYINSMEGMKSWLKARNVRINPLNLPHVVPRQLHIAIMAIEALRPFDKEIINKSGLMISFDPTSPNPSCNASFNVAINENGAPTSHVNLHDSAAMLPDDVANKTMLKTIAPNEPGYVPGYVDQHGLYFNNSNSAMQYRNADAATLATVLPGGADAVFLFTPSYVRAIATATHELAHLRQAHQAEAYNGHYKMTRGEAQFAFAAGRPGRHLVVDSEPGVSRAGLQAAFPYAAGSTLDAEFAHINHLTYDTSHMSALGVNLPNDIGRAIDVLEAFYQGAADNLYRLKSYYSPSYLKRSDQGTRGGNVASRLARYLPIDATNIPASRVLDEINVDRNDNLHGAILDFIDKTIPDGDMNPITKGLLKSRINAMAEGLHQAVLGALQFHNSAAERAVHLHDEATMHFPDIFKSVSGYTKAQYHADMRRMKKYFDGAQIGVPTTYPLLSKHALSKMNEIMKRKDPNSRQTGSVLWDSAVFGEQELYQLGAEMGFFEGFTYEFDSELAVMGTMAPAEFVDRYANETNDIQLQARRMASYYDLRGYSQEGVSTAYRSFNLTNTTVDLQAI